MREFHYVRTLGDQGGVDACPGPAVGLDLEAILADGAPPWRIALEIIAGLCEILDIADEDAKVHGDVALRSLFLDELGALSLEGFGVHRSSPVPRADPERSSTDLYGLGRVAYQLLCEHRPAWPDPSEGADAHDEAVIDALVEVDLQGLPEAMRGDVMWYLGKLLSYDPAQRPSALEAWRTFVAFAGTVEGPDLAGWAAEAIEGRGLRRRSASTSDAEVLDSPRRADGPLSRAMALPEGAGGGTAFWTREDLARTVRGGDPSMTLPPSGVGGGESTGFWKPEQLAAMVRQADEAPRPRRAAGEGERRSQSEVFRRRQASREGPQIRPAALSGVELDGEGGPQAPLQPVTAPTEARRPAPGMEPRPESAPPPPYVPPPLAPEPAVVVQPMSSSVVVSSDRSPANALLMVLLGMGGLGVLTLLLLVAIVAVVSAFVLWTQTRDSVSTPLVVSDPAPTSDEPLRLGLIPTRGKAAGHARVRLSSASRGTVSRCTTRPVSFDGFRAFEVRSDRLPATCLVHIDDAIGTFTVQGSGEVRCDIEGEAVVCERPSRSGR